MGQILDGKAIAAQQRIAIQDRITAYRAATGKRAPGLAVIAVGEDPASQIYIRHKQQACIQVGIAVQLQAYPQDITEPQLITHIQRLNADETIDGILIQLPLPPHLSIARLIEHLDPKKDVDGLHPYNMGCLAQKHPRLRPCTPAGIMTLLAHTQRSLTGLNATIIGVSNIVGRPMIFELLMAGCTPTACHSRTQDLKTQVQTADLIIAATGQPHLIQGNWVKEGAIVIDVGIHRLPNGQLVGDVDFEQARARAQWITPVPGGVGPMTVTQLLANTVTTYET